MAQRTELKFESGNPTIPGQYTMATVKERFLFEFRAFRKCHANFCPFFSVWNSEWVRLEKLGNILFHKLCFMSNIVIKHSVEYVYLSWYFQYMLLSSGCWVNCMTHNATCHRIQWNEEWNGSLDRKDQIPDFIFE